MYIYLALSGGSHLPSAGPPARLPSFCQLKSTLSVHTIYKQSTAYGTTPDQLYRLIFAHALRVYTIAGTLGTRRWFTVGYVFSIGLVTVQFSPVFCDPSPSLEHTFAKTKA